MPLRHPSPTVPSSRERSRSPRRRVGLARHLTIVSLVVGLVVMGATAVPAGSAVAQDDGLEISSTTTYRLDSAAGVIRVTAEYRFRNTLTDEVRGDVIRRPYFTGTTLPLVVGAENPVATTDGTVLTTNARLIPDETDFYLLDVEFSRRLFSGASTTVVLTYDLSGLPPRSEGPWRANAAYAFFEAFGLGDPGRVTVRVEIPAGWSFETFGDEPRRLADGGTTVLLAEAIEDPERFSLAVSARLDDALATREVAVGPPVDASFVVSHWPDDPEWADFVSDQITRGIPELSSSVGVPWPLDDTLVVRQTVTPYLYGYAGWYSVLDDEVEVGEDLDPEVVLHELSHAWFNDRAFTDRWVNEGLAQVYSNLVVGRLGGTPTEPEQIDPAAPAARPLAEWETPALSVDDETAEAIEEYGYNASWWVMDALVDEIGEAAMAEVVAGAFAELAVYPAVDAEVPAVDEPAQGSVDGTLAPEEAVDWQRFLDLLERVGGSTEASALFAEHVLADDDAEVLDERAAAIDAYDGLLDRADGWSAPVGLRDAMTTWDFAAAAPIVTAAGRALDAREALLAAADALGVEVRDELRPTFETAAAGDDLDEATAELDDLRDAIDVVSAAQARLDAPRDLATRVGLMGEDLEPARAAARAALERGDADAARSAAADLVDRLDRAPSVGRTRIRNAALAAGGVLVLLLLVVVLLIRRHRRRRRTPPALASLHALDVPPSRPPDVSA